MNPATYVLLLVAGVANAAVLESPCNSTFKDIAAGTEYSILNSTESTLGPCLHSFQHVEKTHAVLECYRVTNGRSIFVSTTGNYGAKSELHGNDFEGKITGDLAGTSGVHEINVTVSAPVALPALPEHATAESLGGIFQHTEYNCSVKVVSADTTANLKPVPAVFEADGKAYVVKSGEAFSVTHENLLKGPLNFQIPNEVRPTISCEKFNVGENVILGLSATGVVPKTGLTFTAEQLHANIFGYLPIHKDAPQRLWTLELDSKDNGDKTKAIVDCILGGDIFVHKA